MNKEKIFLGTLRKDAGTFADGERIYINKHSWDCNWYWGFGYLDNARTHFHFDSLLKGSPKLASDLFISPRYTDKNWWIIRDLFIQAYALKKAAEVYRHGGHQTTKQGLTDIIMSQDKADSINKDLEKVLDTLWNFLEQTIDNILNQ